MQYKAKMIKLNWRKLDHNDYPMLVGWWDDWGWEGVPSLKMLPQGYLVYDEESLIPLYAGFIYYTGTTMAWMEYIVSNKNADIQLKKGALNYLIEVMSTIAKNNGVEAIFTSTSNDSFVNSLRKCNFIVSEKNTQLIKNL